MSDCNNEAIKNRKLRDIRSASKLTQDDMAKYLGMTRSAYQHLEAKGNLTGDILYRLSRYFDRPIEDFIEGADFKHKAPMRLRETNQGSSLKTAYLTAEEIDYFKILSTLSHESKVRALGYLIGLKQLEDESN